MRLLIVIPTRNRPDLAATAIASVLRATGEDLRVLISDNSTSDRQADQLATYCRALRDDRLQYKRPAAPLARSAHWDWAIHQGLRSGEFTHVSLVTDRMLMKPGSLPALVAIARRYPEHVITYKLDAIIDTGSPVRLVQHPWTGNVFELGSSELLEKISQLVQPLFTQLPGMGNCITPVAVVQAVHRRYGSVFGSTVPSTWFALRCLERVTSIVCCDIAPALEYAVSLSRSLAMFAREDTQNAGPADDRHVVPTYAAPVPELRTFINAFVHEYCVLSQEVQSPRMPSIDLLAYFAANEREISHTLDADLRRQNQAVLARHVPMTIKSPRHGDPRAGWVARRGSPRALRQQLARLACNARPAPLWRLLEYWGVSAPSAALTTREFTTTAAAIEYACTARRPRNWGWSELELYTTANLISRMPAA